MGKIIAGAIGILFVLSVLWFILWVPFMGWHYETSRGEHTGYVTAVEKSGVFFKTGTAYIKTDTQSSQEDIYCVMDDAVQSDLQKYSLSKTHVNVYYFGWFSAGIANCAGEGEIIYKVEPIAS